MKGLVGKDLSELEVELKGAPLIKFEDRSKGNP
jgi:hypothetical protein